MRGSGGAMPRAPRIAVARRLALRQCNGVVRARVLSAIAALSLCASLWLAPLAAFSVPAPGVTPAVLIESGPLGGGAGRRAGPALLAAAGSGRQFAPMLFQADFDTRDWSGRFSRIALASDAEGQVRIGAQLWEAGQRLDAEFGPGGVLPARGARDVETVSDVAGPPETGDVGETPMRTSPFSWDELSERQRGLLDVAAGVGMESGAADGLGRQRLDFLRGERSLEVGQPGGLFRRRGGLLGDAIHSAPVLVGPPGPGIQGDGYAEFYARHQGRRSVVYLGANDGMLHAFDADSGGELFAYIPNALMGGLNALSSSAYAHRAYVDGGAAAAEALLPAGWKTVLVSGLGGGAQGVFALDVSDPQRFADGGALWEFGDGDDPAIGNVLAAPAIAKFRVGTKNGLPLYRYFAVVASGWNNYVDDGEERFLGSAEGALFLLALDKPLAEAWKRGSNYYRVTTPQSEPASANALAAPALVTGPDGAVRYAYVGDLQGNLWCFDFSAATAWYGGKGAAPTRRLVLVARDADGLRQPITGQVRIAFAPDGGYLLLFGTGKFIEQADTLPASFRPQSFYAVRDVPTVAAPSASRAALAPRILQGPDRDGAGFVLSGAPFVYTGVGAKRGWYLDFADTAVSGERSVSAAELMAGKVYFNTVLPGLGSGAGTGARSYAVDILTGLSFDAAGDIRSGNATGILLPEGSLGAPMLLVTGAGDGAGSGTDAAPPGQRVTRLNVGVSAAGVAVTVTASAAMPVRSGRVSWREVANWRDLHMASSP